ncbi:hypothetical protein AVEN_258662-1, partial [Araneus ventricosus]
MVSNETRWSRGWKGVSGPLLLITQ